MATSKKPTVKANPAKDKKVTKVVKTVVPATVEPSPETRNVQPGDTVETPVEVFEHIVTEQDLIDNPTLVEDGIKVGDTIQIPVKAPATNGETPSGENQPPANENETPSDENQAPAPEANAKPIADEITAALMEKMQPYLKAYPTNKTFYIATDGQVFLEANKGDAIMHQRTLDGELVTFKAV